MSGEAGEALARLAEMDARLDALAIERLTLDPNRDRASSLEALGEALLPRTRGLPEGSASAWASGLVASVESVLAHFPGNLFWDLDLLAASVLREAARMPDALAHICAAFEEIVALHALFGHATTIHFRYVHDFVYGFDWAKWVRRDPRARASVGPFDLAFLRSMRARGGELLALIAEDDAKYPRLRREGARNPFVFSREPAAELRLHRDLARRDLVPVRAWCVDETPSWDRPFAEEREARARALGLTGGEGHATR